MDWLLTRHAVARRNQDYLARLKRYAEHEPGEFTTLSDHVPENLPPDARLSARSAARCERPFAQKRFFGMICELRAGWRLLVYLLLSFVFSRGNPPG